MTKRNPNTIHVSIMLDTDLKRLAEEAAKADRRNVSSLIAYLLEEHCPSIIERRKRMLVGQ